MAAESAILSSLLGSGGLGGVLGGKSGTKVSQSTSLKSNTSLSIALTNLIGGGTTGPTTAPLTAVEAPNVANASQAPLPSAQIPVFTPSAGTDFLGPTTITPDGKAVQNLDPKVVLFGLAGAALVLFMFWRR